MLNRCKQKKPAATGKHVIVLFLCVMLWLPSLFLPAQTAASREMQEEVVFHKAAKKAIYKKEWSVAVRQFRKLETRFPNSKLRAEALYWMAYSMEKLSRVPGEQKQKFEEKAEAISLLNQLLDNVKESPWIDDAQRLRIQIATDLVLLGKSFYKKYITTAVQGSGQNDLKIVALGALLRIERDRALELLSRMYVRNKKSLVREKIIFLLRRFGETNAIKQLLNPRNRKGSVEISEQAGRMGTRIGHIIPPKVITRVTPVYPEEALQEGITGKVVLIVVVNLRGYVIEADVQGKSHPLFKESAIKAVKQWRYRPYTYQGSRTYVRVKITFKFHLTGK